MLLLTVVDERVELRLLLLLTLVETPVELWLLLMLLLRLVEILVEPWLLLIMLLLPLRLTLVETPVELWLLIPAPLVDSLEDSVLLIKLLLIKRLLVSLEEAIVAREVRSRLDAMLVMDSVLVTDSMLDDEKTTSDEDRSIIDVVVSDVVAESVDGTSEVAVLGPTVVVVVEDVLGTGAMKLGLGVLVCRTLSMQTTPAMAPTETSVQPTKGPPKAAKIDPPQS